MAIVQFGDCSRKNFVGSAGSREIWFAEVAAGAIDVGAESSPIGQWQQEVGGSAKDHSPFLVRERGPDAGRGELRPDATAGGRHSAAATVL